MLATTPSSSSIAPSSESTTVTTGCSSENDSFGDTINTSNNKEENHSSNSNHTDVDKSLERIRSQNATTGSSSSTATTSSSIINPYNAKNVHPTPSKMEAFEIDTNATTTTTTTYVAAATRCDMKESDYLTIRTVPSEDTLGDEIETESDVMKSLLDDTPNSNSSSNNNNNPNQANRDNKIRSLANSRNNMNCGINCCSLCTIPLPPSSLSHCTGSCIRLGNLYIPSTTIFDWTGGWGVFGPHWFGPPCVAALILFATVYFAYQCSWRNGWYWTASVCFLFSLSTLYHLFSAAYRNPGVIVKGQLTLPDPLPRTWRYCETCDYYQPPRAVHCPDCDVCIAKFDHHCVWMGTCVGVGNFKPFMRFNLSWLSYLLYAVIWVSIIAPIIEGRHHSAHP